MPAQLSEKQAKALKAQQDRYLQAVGKTGTLTAGCRAARVSPNTVYKWREHDEMFTLAEQQAKNEFADNLEEEAVRRAWHGVNRTRRVYDNRGNLIDEYTETVYSDTLLMFALKAIRPEKFRDRLQLQHADADGQKFPIRAIREALGIGAGADED